MFPTPENFPVLWATKIRMEMQLGLTLCAFTDSCNHELILLCHLLFPPVQNIIISNKFELFEPLPLQIIAFPCLDLSCLDLPCLALPEFALLGYILPCLAWIFL